MLILGACTETQSQLCHFVSLRFPKFQTYVHNLFVEDSSKLICRKATTADDRELYALNMRREDEALKEVEV